jgi:predicted HAD superfamily phosphohydrolase YqeG
MIAELDDVSEEELKSKIIDFPRKTTHEKVIVFDLDETLAHSTVNDTEEEKQNS